MVTRLILAGSPFVCVLHELILFPMRTQKRLLQRNTSIVLINHQGNTLDISLTSSTAAPCATLYAAVRSRNTTPVLRFFWKPFTMRAIALVLRPCLKPDIEDRV